MDEAIERRYLDECMPFCPRCEATDQIRRVLEHPRSVTLTNERPVMVVNCYCGRCAGEWSELYRLERVFLAQPTEG